MVNLNAVNELLWIKVTTGDDVMLVGALYHPPAPIYSETDLLDRIETHIEENKK
jgi:hypothetical protein